jgi:enamine deaminase RidA (YjgF/YER057c/UK114 family)
MVKAVTEYLKGAVEVPHHRTLVMVGAQAPLDAKGKLASGFEAQCAAAWARVIDALAEKNFEPRHIVAVDLDLADRAHLAAAAEEQRRHVRHQVAQAVRIVGLADPAWMVQVSVVAARTT